ncbi:MAG: hypothetical protein KF900_04540 [Bacteroidetes bacterium]|nr:hypothetical protein [Bacteroidota bacterium]
MKKLSVLAVVAMMAAASCSKDRVCTCTTSAAGASGTPQKTTYVGVSKGQAKAQCVTKKYDVSGVTVTTTCELE